MLAKVKLNEQQQICLNAANYIRKHGWWNGSKETALQPDIQCMAMALNHECSAILSAILWDRDDEESSRQVQECYDKLWQHVLKHMNMNDGAEVVKWNDTHTAEDVIAKLEELAYAFTAEGD